MKIETPHNFKAMNHYGKKQIDWMHEIDASTYANTETTASVKTPKAKRLFEYTGPDLLILKGVITGKPYYFKYPGAQVAVAHEDSYAMLGEPFLTLIS